MTDDWRCITVKQPWASCIATGAKTVENRSRPHSWRGHLAIHAGKQWSERGRSDDRVVNALAKKASSLTYPYLQTSALIAVAELVDVHADTGCCRPWGESYYHAYLLNRNVTHVFHYVMEDIAAIVPIPCAGHLGLWRPDQFTMADLDEARHE